MTSCHNVLLLLDTAGAARKSHVQLVALRVLNYLSCRFGLGRVRWGFQFFDSQGARSRPSRVSDFRELGPGSWEDFEEELEARFGDRAQRPHLPGPATRATHIQNVLTETLLDYQWDLPEISSPTKPFLRSSRRRLLGSPDEPGGPDADLRGVMNAVFLFSLCPHSQRELLQFVARSDAHSQHQLPTTQVVMEKLLPRRVQEILMGRKISLYWVDTTEMSKLQDSPDHLGYWTMFELFHRVGGTILPSEILAQCFNQDGEKLPYCERVNADQGPAQLRFSPWISSLPFESTLNCLLCQAPRHQAIFPQIEGTLFLPVEGNKPQQNWTVTLEPLAMHQRNFQRPVNIFLNGTVTHWTHPMSSSFGTESWMLQSLENEKSEQGRLFQQLVRRLSIEELHLVADVVPGEGWPPSTGIISPLSTTATILTVFRNERSEFQENLHKDVTENPQDTTYLLPDVVNSVLNQIYNSQENSCTSVNIPVSEWAQQELGRTHPWSTAVVEKWFPFSNHSGASSNLMESFCLLQATSTNKEESSKAEGELTHFLSEFYQRKSCEEFTAVGQEDKKKRGIPCTPVRQKMKSMSRSLKMLNVARLNVKAQKLQPDCSPSSSTGEKIVQKATSRRTEEKLEEKGKMLRSSKPKDFKTEEELLSHLNENYQKTVATEEVLPHKSAQNMILTIKMFLKSRDTKDLEMTCLDRVKNYLLKTSKGLRQQLGKNLDKEAKVREYQLQVFLRLEMCLQCPSIQNSLDDMEHLVEEVTDLLRAVCLTEDPAYLSRFLEEILGLYIDSIPKTLGNLYYSLGFVIPQKLAVILPADFFSDDSMTQESGSPTLSVPPTHNTVSVSTESDQLEELRTRSAKKRKHALTRHRSVTEAAQNLRQIEIPKVPKRATKKENFHTGHQQPPVPVKDLVQEVTKVRRNLFNQEMLSPSKRSGKRLPRSHSVSAVEGLKYKVDNFKEIQDYHKLLTKRVSETPLHKQVSRRLLQRQIKGRSSDSGPDIDVVEESPEKEYEMSLRRSPRIKHLSFLRTNSAFFYPVSQPKPRNIQKLCLRQKDESGTKECPIIQGILSPKRLFFGAVSEMTTPTKELHRIKRSPENSSDSEKPVYETPRKSGQEPRTPTNRILRRSPRTPQMVYHTPRKQRKTISKNTSTDQIAFKNSTKDLEVTSPSKAKVIPQKESPLQKEFPSPLEKMELRTPKRQRSQTSELLETPPWSLQRNSSLANVSCSLAQFSFTVQATNNNYLTPIKHSQKTPQKSAASASPRRHDQVVSVTPLSQRNQDPNVLIHKVAQPGEYIKELDKTAPNIKGSGNMVAVFTPPVSSQKKKLFNSPPHDASIKTPTSKSFVDSLSPTGLEEFGWGILQKSPTVTVTPLACNLVSTPRKKSRVTKSSNSVPPPPSKRRKQHMNRNNSNLERSLPLDQFSTFDDHTVEQRDVATIDSSPKEQKKVNVSSPFSPKEHFHPLGGIEYELLGSSLLTTQNATEHQSSDNSETCIKPVEGLKMPLIYEQPSTSNEVASPSAKPMPPLVPSYAFRCTADRRQRQAAARLADPKALPQPSEEPLKVISASPPTYEVELEMQASGLPKLRIKRVDSNSVSTEKQKKMDASLGVENFTDVGCLLHPSKPSQLEAAYVSPPCLHSSHTTPGKSGGQMYICQSYTPTHFPSSTASPSPTNVWVPWTPSPRHKGKTIPDTIQDWPRKKKAVDSNINSCGGKNERGSDLLGNISGIEEEGKERAFEQCVSKTPILGDFEFEGIYRLPDQSPSSDCEPRAEDSFSKGQFGLFSSKRPIYSKEETEHQTRRSCVSQKENQVISVNNETKEERKSPSRSTRQPSSMGDDEVFVSDSTPPNCAVRNCLSASGLLALTQSPLLYQGKEPSFHRKDIRDEEMDIFPSTADQESPFNIAISQRHPISRTYTRKRLLS